MIDSIEKLQGLVRDGVTDFKEYGHVRTFFNEEKTLIGFDYTPEAEYEGTWNYFERISRGLVLEVETGEIVARPYDKFFNLGQHNAYPNSKIKYVMDKADGSLGIIFNYKGATYVNTRGSFASDQAKWATEYCRRNGLKADSGFTLLCEIIYPDNRIVVNYDGWEGLILHGCRVNSTGEYISLDALTAAFQNEISAGVVRVIEVFQIETLTAAKMFVDTLCGTEAEGVVVLDEDGERFKIKGEDYLRLHRLVTDVTPKRVWEIMCAGNYDEHKDQIPDEFIDEVEGYRKEIQDWVDKHTQEAKILVERSPKDVTQKEFALWVNQQEPMYRPYLFQQRQGRDVSNFFLPLWKKMTGYYGA